MKLTPFIDLCNPQYQQYDEMIKDFVLSGINKSSKTITKAPLLPKMPDISQKKKRQIWKPEEDLIVLELVEKYGQKWNIISKMMSNRNGKQIRDRYLNVLMPNIKKSGWTEQEDALIMSLYEKCGSKWRQIAEELQGRTEAQVKNRFHIYLKGLYVKKQDVKIGKEKEVLGRTQRNTQRKIVQIRAYNVLSSTPSTCFESPKSSAQVGFEGKATDFADMMFSFQ